MLTKVCIEVGVIDYEFHDSYFVSLKLKRGCIICGTNSTMTICDWTYLGVKCFNGKVELAIYKME